MHTSHVKLSRRRLRRRYKKKKKLTKHRELRMQSVENTRELRLMCVLSVIFKRSRLLRCLSDDPVAPLGCPSATRVAREQIVRVAFQVRGCWSNLVRDLTYLPRGELSVSLRGFPCCPVEPCRVLPHLLPAFFGSSPTGGARQTRSTISDFD